MMQTFYTSGYSREDSELSIPIYKKQPVDNKIADMQAEIDELVDMLDKVIKCWRGTEPNDPSRAIVRAAGEELLAKHKQEKE